MTYDIDWSAGYFNKNMKDVCFPRPWVFKRITSAEINCNIKKTERETQMFCINALSGS